MNLSPLFYSKFYFLFKFGEKKTNFLLLYLEKKYDRSHNFMNLNAS